MALTVLDITWMVSYVFSVTWTHFEIRSHNCWTVHTALAKMTHLPHLQNAPEQSSSLAESSLSTIYLFLVGNIDSGECTCSLEAKNVWQSLR